MNLKKNNKKARMIKVTLSIMAFLFMLSMGSHRAYSFSGEYYPCWIYYRPHAMMTTGGDYGSIQAYFYTGPKCTGSIVGYCWLPSLNSIYAANTEYDESSLMMMLQTITTAAHNGQSMSVTSNTDGSCGALRVSP